MPTFARLMGRNLSFTPEEKLEKALSVFWSKGYKAASLAELTEAMQLNKSSLYNSFGDKRSLFKQCLKNYGNLTEQEYERAIDKEGSAIENLFNIIDTIVAVSIERPNSCLAIKTSFELEIEDEEINSLIKVGSDKIIRRLHLLISQAQVDGAIQAARNASTMAHFVFNSFAGFRQSYIQYGNKALVLSLADELKGFLMQ
jgi:TetR/AcrR family transcriptional repressor of nem operon